MKVTKSSSYSLSVRVNEFALPPVTDGLVLGKDAPIGVQAVTKALNLLSANHLESIHMDDDVIASMFRAEGDFAHPAGQTGGLHRGSRETADGPQRRAPPGHQGRGGHRGNQPMKRLTARDALSERLVHVTADRHPSPGGHGVHRETVYAVEEEVSDGAGPRKFLGLVDSRQANLFPSRIFADLLRPRQSAHVTAGTPLETVQQELLEGAFYALPVMDDDGAFLGAVTRDSLLRAVIERERELSQAVKQGLDLQEQQHSLIAFEIHDGLVQYVTAARMYLDTAAGTSTRTARRRPRNSPAAWPCCRKPSTRPGL